MADWQLSVDSDDWLSDFGRVYHRDIITTPRTKWRVGKTYIRKERIRDIPEVFVIHFELEKGGG
jgi:hypothetical protein